VIEAAELVGPVLGVERPRRPALSIELGCIGQNPIEVIVSLFTVSWRACPSGSFQSLRDVTKGGRSVNGGERRERPRAARTERQPNAADLH
jgi:hypothetical protein